MQIQRNQESFSIQKVIYVCTNVCLFMDICIGEGNTLKEEPIKREIPEGTYGKTGQRLNLLRITNLCICRERRSLA